MKSKILYFGQDFEKEGRLKNIFVSADVAAYSDSSYVIDLLNVEPPDIIIADADFPDTKKFVKNIKSLFENTSIYIVTMVDADGVISDGGGFGVYCGACGVGGGSGGGCRVVGWGVVGWGVMGYRIWGGGLWGGGLWGEGLWGGGL